MINHEAFIKRRLALYDNEFNYKLDGFSKSRQLKIASKLVDDYKQMDELARSIADRDDGGVSGKKSKRRHERIDDKETKRNGENTNTSKSEKISVSKALQNVRDSIDKESSALVLHQNNNDSRKTAKKNNLIRLGASDLVKDTSLALSSRRKAVEVVEPKWHAPWKISKVLAGHVGWVRCVTVDPSNEFFFTGSSDRTIKCWDLASGKLKLTLTGHSHGVRGLACSPNHPYLFSVGEDKTVKCWDLETNQVIRHYHGHLQAVHCVAVHPKLDVIMTGSRDASVRVWDMRTRHEVHLLSGHENSVEAILTESSDPQIISGSMDKTIKLWDLAAGKVMTTLTNHSKGVRALAKNPMEHSFISGAADCLKKWEYRTGKLMLNLSGHAGIVNAVAVSRYDVLFSGGDDGSVRFWDWPSGHCFMSERTIPQPGSLDCEACIYAATFDLTGKRLITCEADKSVKIWKEDENASKDSHPLTWDRERATYQQTNERY